MSIFLTVFILVYSSFHVLFYFRVRVLFPPGMPQLLFILFLISMILAPIGIRLLERNGFEYPAEVLAHIGYSWMGFVFISTSVFLAAGFIDLIIRMANSFLNQRIPSLSGPAPVVVLLVLISAVWVYGYIDALNIRVERVTIETSKLPENVDTLRIAQISDVHLGLIVRSERLKRIIDLIRAENPDILVSTGDLIDGAVGRAEELLVLFETVQPRFGKYAITGNHEYYAGVAEAVDSMDQFGFKVLRGEAYRIENVINVAGVDDPTYTAGIKDSIVLPQVQNGLFTLLLKHRPEASPDSLGLFDLQLSGHAHRGQIFPFNLITAKVYPMQDGYYELPKGSRLYTSRGTGTWGPPIRVLSPPEVTIITLKRVAAIGEEE